MESGLHPACCGVPESGIRHAGICDTECFMLTPTAVTLLAPVNPVYEKRPHRQKAALDPSSGRPLARTCEPRRLDKL